MIIENMPFKLYLALDKISASKLYLLQKSAAHYERLKDQKIESKELLLGSMVHCLALQPELFEEQYVIMSEGVDRRTKAGKEEYELNLVSGKEIVLFNQAEHAKLITKHLLKNDLARSLLDNSRKELTLQWEENGVACKARMDALTPEGTIVDLKTTMDSSAKGFMKAIVHRSYYLQAAWYLRGAKANQIEAREFIFLAMEKGGAYLAAAYRLSTEALCMADREIDVLLARYKEAKDTQVFKGYTSSYAIETLDLPSWRMAEVESEDDNILEED